MSTSSREDYRLSPQRREAWLELVEPPRAPGHAANELSPAPSDDLLEDRLQVVRDRGHGFGPPLHVHRREDEGFYVLEGEIRFR